MEYRPRDDGWRRGRSVKAWLGAFALALVILAPAAAGAADTSYPFEGTWIRAERPCTAGTVRSRSYTAKEVASPRGRCSIRRIAANTGTYELLEECRRNDKPQMVTEIIRMTSPDSLTLRRQVVRLKIPRQIRYARCSIAANAVAPGRASKGRDRDADGD